MEKEKYSMYVCEWEGVGVGGGGGSIKNSFYNITFFEHHTGYLIQL